MHDTLHGSLRNSQEALFDGVERTIDSNIAEVVLTLSAQSATIRSLTIEGDLLTLTVVGRVNAIRLKGDPAEIADSSPTAAMPVQTSSGELNVAPGHPPPPDIKEPAAVLSPAEILARQWRERLAAGEPDGPRPSPSAPGVVLEDLD